VFLPVDSESDPTWNAEHAGIFYEVFNKLNMRNCSQASVRKARHYLSKDRVTFCKCWATGKRFPSTLRSHDLHIGSDNLSRTLTSIVGRSRPPTLMTRSDTSINPHLVCLVHLKQSLSSSENDAVKASQPRITATTRSLSSAKLRQQQSIPTVKVKVKSG
jgi:hypothetical protein